MNQSAIDQAAAAGVSPLTATGASVSRPFDLSSSRSRNVSERIIGLLLGACGLVSLLTTVGIISVLFFQTVEFFRSVSVFDFYLGTEWLPNRGSDPLYGVLPLITGTLTISVIAMLISIPMGLLSAIYLSEYAPSRVRSVLKPVLELLAGIPTVVYGFFALTFITPNLLQALVGKDRVGAFNALSAGIAVGIMILPMVASLSEDSMRAVPRSLREGGYAMGATKLEVSTRVVLPAALSGIFASFILAISRAVGETMIIVVAAGSRPADLIPNPLQQLQAMTAYIVQVFSGDVSRGSVRYQSLFAVGSTLFLMTLLLNIVSQRLVARFREEYQ